MTDDFLFRFLKGRPTFYFSFMTKLPIWGLHRWLGRWPTVCYSFMTKLPIFRSSWLRGSADILFSIMTIKARVRTKIIFLRRNCQVSTLTGPVDRPTILLKFNLLKCIFYLLKRKIRSHQGRLIMFILPLD